MYKLAIACWLCLLVKGQENFANNSRMVYDPEELLTKIFYGNVTRRTRNFKFENEFDSNFNNIVFDDQSSNYQNPTQFKFEIDQATNTANIPNIGNSNDDIIATNVKFEDAGQDVTENGFNNLLDNGPQPGIKGEIGKKKKRRRRKPRQQFPNQPGYWNPGYPHANGLGPNPGVNLGPNHFSPEFNGPFHRPPRRPEPSLASGALTAVTGALTSIAHNDDYQCVARLLCEAAAGGALGSSSLLDSVSGLEPLLTLLSAYNGISSNPLFVFGRAAFLGMSSKGSPGSCRYAYPLCPTDPEELVHYLNNHNGGFFRFFNAPQQGQQNLQQFYNQLSQNYGLYKPHPGNNPNFNGLPNPGLYHNPADQANLYHNGNGNGYQQNYGFEYPYNQNNQNGYGLRFKSNNELDDNQDTENYSSYGKEIQKRIQNKPASFNDNFEESDSKWLFPGEDDGNKDESKIEEQYVNTDDFGFIRNTKGKKLRFPDTSAIYNIADIQKINNKPFNFDAVETQQKPKGIYFPYHQSNFKNTNEFYRPAYTNRFFYNNINQKDEEAFKRLYNNYNNQNNNNEQQDTPGATTVYVIRGNGDPNKPEIIKLRPGESL